jgi:hypothetical protein
MQLEQPNMKVLGNVSIIVVGIMIASYGEIAFVLIGVIYQACGILFESIRLVMVQKLLSSAEYKMDPLVSLYYFAPVGSLKSALKTGLCGHECDLLSDIRRTHLDPSGCPRHGFNHTFHECCCRILPQRCSCLFGMSESFKFSKIRLGKRHL